MKDPFIDPSPPSGNAAAGGIVAPNTAQQSGAGAMVALVPVRAKGSGFGSLA